MALSLDIGCLRRGSLRSECSDHLSYVGAASNASAVAERFRGARVWAAARPRRPACGSATASSDVRTGPWRPI